MLALPLFGDGDGCSARFFNLDYSLTDLYDVLVGRSPHEMIEIFGVFSVFADRFVCGVKVLNKIYDFAFRCGENEKFGTVFFARSGKLKVAPRAGKLTNIYI